MLGNVPHDWLFPRVSAVVHHGGAGTTAIGIALGKPTVIVPFFGDQPWWAGMIYRAGAGPEAVPYKKLTSDSLARNITRALEPDIKEKAHELAMKIAGENGPKKAAEAFHATSQMKNVACFLCPDHVAVWRIRRTNVQLSSRAVGTLITKGKINPDHLKMVRHKRWYVEEGAQGPLIGLVAAFAETAMGVWNDVWDYEAELKGKPPINGMTNSERKMEAVRKFDEAHLPNGWDDGTEKHVEKPAKKNGMGKRVAKATGNLAVSVTVHGLRCKCACP